MLYLNNYPSFGDDDKEALRLLIRQILRPNCRVLEIGSWLGTGSTRVIVDELRFVNDGRLYYVDTWKGSKNIRKHERRDSTLDVKSSCRRHSLWARL